MSHSIYRYRFSDRIAAAEIENSLLLAHLAVESLHGEAQVRLDAGHSLDAAGRTVVIDGATAVGRDLNRLFLGFVAKEFGEDAFDVQRVAPERRFAEATVP